MDLNKEIKKLRKKQAQLFEEKEETQSKERSHLDTLARCCVYFVTTCGKITHANASEESTSLNAEHQVKDLIVSIHIFNLNPQGENSCVIKVRVGKQIVLKLTGSYNQGIYGIKKQIYIPGEEWEKKIMYARK